MTLIGGQIALTAQSTFTIGLKMNERIRDLALNVTVAPFISELKMNERMRDLALDAIVQNIAAEGWVFSDEELQRFAESIIKVCIKQGELIQSQTVTNASEQYAAGREMGIQVYMNQIRKVFGVE
jgi:hypothetical protein